MVAPSERMKAMRDRRRMQGLREVRLVVPDARADFIRQRVAVQVACLSKASESDAMDWAEMVSEFDEAR